MDLLFECPQCKAKFQIDATLSGRKARCPECNEAFIVPEVVIGPGVIIGGFRLEKHLGKGSMGQVFLGTQLSMSRKVAVKILPQSMTRSEEAIEQFIHEIRTIAVMDHPNIITAFDAGDDNGTLYLAMAFVDGEDFKHIVERDGPLAEGEALSVVRAVAVALRYAWEEHKLLHRDIKPENIMRDRHGQIKLMDLGISKSINEEMQEDPDVVVGTPHYMSPEHAWSNQSVDFRADLYSLGATLYMLLTGRPPYLGDVQTVFNLLQIPEPITPARSFNAKLSELCGYLLETMLAANRDNRHPSWTELIEDIDRVLKGELPKHLVPATKQALIAKAAIPEFRLRSLSGAARTGETALKTPNAGGTTTKAAPVAAPPVVAPPIAAPPIAAPPVVAPPAAPVAAVAAAPPAPEQPARVREPGPPATALPGAAPAPPAATGPTAVRAPDGPAQTLAEAGVVSSAARIEPKAKDGAPAFRLKGAEPRKPAAAVATTPEQQPAAPATGGAAEAPAAEQMALRPPGAPADDGSSGKSKRQRDLILAAVAVVLFIGALVLVFGSVFSGPKKSRTRPGTGAVAATPDDPPAKAPDESPAPNDAGDGTSRPPPTPAPEPATAKPPPVAAPPPAVPKPPSPEELARLRKLMDEQVKTELALLKVDERAVATRLKFPWPVEEPKMSVEQVAETIKKAVAQAVDKKFPNREKEYRTAAQLRFGYYKVGDTVNLSLVHGTGRRVTGVVSQVGADSVVVDEQRIAFIELYDDDRDRFRPEKAKEKVETYVRTQLDKDAKARVAYEAKVRAETGTREYGQAGYIQRGDQWLPRKRLLAEEVAKEQAAKEAELRQRIEREVFTKDGYTLANGQWVK